MPPNAGRNARFPIPAKSNEFNMVVLSSTPPCRTLQGRFLLCVRGRVCMRVHMHVYMCVGRSTLNAITQVSSTMIF